MLINYWDYNMNLQESIRRVLREETKSGKYITMIKDLTNEFKEKDCLCDIEVSYNRKNNYYSVFLVFSRKELEDKVSKKMWWTNYVRKILNEVKMELETYLPIQNMIIDYKTIENCDESLNESENKKPSLLRAIEQDGLYQVMQDTGLTLPKIYTKTGELPREVLERYIKDFVENEALSIPGSEGDIGFVFSIPLFNDREVDSFYMSKGKITLEINEYDPKGRIVAGSHERLVNLSDKELFVIVDQLSHVNNDYFDDM